MMDVLSHLAPVVLLSLMLIVFSSNPCQGRRYRRCQDGCCIHEYCAYGLVCYPRIHCHFGCPDGYCAGSEKTAAGAAGAAGAGAGGATDATKNRDDKLFTSSVSVKITGTADNNDFGSSRSSEGIPSPQITENYAYSDDNAFKSKREEGGSDGKTREGSLGGIQSNGNSRGETPDGICMPLPPCNKKSSSFSCGMGRSCSFNFNLGYNVCQYNLDIGTTLCFDTHGNYLPKPKR